MVLKPGCERRRGRGGATDLSSVLGRSVPVVVMEGAGAFTKRKTSEWGGMFWARRGRVCAEYIHRAGRGSYGDSCSRPRRTRGI